jgi:hypothetical protein
VQGPRATCFLLDRVLVQTDELFQGLGSERASQSEVERG